MSEAGEADQTLAQGLTLAASSLHNAVGATTGPLYASALLRAASALGAETQVPLSRLPEVIVAMAEGSPPAARASPATRPWSMLGRLPPMPPARACRRASPRPRCWPPRLVPQPTAHRRRAR
ncbi:hypothetical protein FLP41_07860 [Paracoccus marcusii]|nr:hypothetical protein FLP41_07860 [Paracoccus marcusii]